MFLGGTIDIFKVMTERFQSTGGDINKLTTGRFDLWISYIEYLIINPKYLILGKGIGAGILGKAAHNTYVELLYHFGVLGTAFFISVLKQFRMLSYTNIKRNMMNYSVLVCILIMYFFWGEIFYFDSPFHLVLVIAVLNINMDEKIMY